MNQIKEPINHRGKAAIIKFFTVNIYITNVKKDMVVLFKIVYIHHVLQFFKLIFLTNTFESVKTK